MKDGKEVWFDRRHLGALRVVDTTGRHIYGSDPAEEKWTVPFEKAEERGAIKVDFAAKRTHHGKRYMVARYKKGRNELHWCDGNVWLRLRTDPVQLLLEHA